MPKRTINTRRNKAATTTPDAATTTTPDADTTPVAVATDAATDAATTPDATPDTTTPDATPDAATTPDASDFTTTPDAVITLDTTTPDTTLTPHPVPTPDATPDGAAKPATPDAKAEFLERKAAAILSALPVYNGPSLAVHRSDKQPAGAEYLSRVAKPVQIAKSISPRDDSALLTYYDHLTTYHGADYTAGFNPDRFGADLGAVSRNASLNRIRLTDCGNHVMLTELGLANARNLAATRDKRNTKA